MSCSYLTNSNGRGLVRPPPGAPDVDEFAERILCPPLVRAVDVVGDEQELVGGEEGCAVPRHVGRQAHLRLHDPLCDELLGAATGRVVHEDVDVGDEEEPNCKGQVHGQVVPLGTP